MSSVTGLQIVLSIGSGLNLEDILLVNVVLGTKAAPSNRQRSPVQLPSSFYQEKRHIAKFRHLVSLLARLKLAIGAEPYLTDRAICTCHLQSSSFRFAVPRFMLQHAFEALFLTLIPEKKTVFWDGLLGERSSYSSLSLI